MKTCKRLSALLLALLLAFGVASPAAAETEALDAELSVELPDAELSAEIDVLSDASPSPASPAPRDDNPAMPIITKQPQSITVKCCEEFTLSVEAYIPNGDEVGYRWYRNGDRIDDATGPTLTVPYYYYYSSYDSSLYYCNVYNKSNSRTYVDSERAIVTMEPCPDMPVIAKHPQDAVNTYGKTTLSVDANIPSGDPVGYVWVCYSWVDSAYRMYPNGSSVVISFEKNQRLVYRPSYSFLCGVYNTKDSTTLSGPHRLRSEGAVISISLGPIGQIFKTLSYPVLVAGSHYIGPLFWPLLPFSLPFYAIAYVIDKLFGLGWL